MFSNEIFRCSETKTSTENRDTAPPPLPPPPPPPSYSNFFDTRNYCNSKGFPYGNFRHWDKKFSTENLDTPPPLPLIQTFSVPEISETLKGSPTKFFGTETKKFSTENLDTPPPPLIQTFSIPEINETLKDSPPPLRKFLALWDKKFSIENLETPPPPPPLLSINFFATGNFLKHSTEGFTYQIFRHCETKKIRQKIENRGITLWSINFFDTRN